MQTFALAAMVAGLAAIRPTVSPHAEAAARGPVPRATFHGYSPPPWEPKEPTPPNRAQLAAEEKRERKRLLRDRNDERRIAGMKRGA
jgi:hypothetical protein